MKHIHYIFIISILLIIIVVLAVNLHLATNTQKEDIASHNASKTKQVIWTAPDTANISDSRKGDLIRYGRELIVHTAVYLGPNGSISQTANGLNCENCHLAAGTRLYANNFSKVAVSYPKYRPRRDSYVSIADRINGCMQRSMNGEPLDTNSREVKAMIAYFNWIGQGVDDSTKLLGEGTEEISFLERAADPRKGKIVFMNNCASCHGQNGAGKLKEDASEYLYPPLWGAHSYNMGAGLYRLSKLARFVKNNMPFGTTYHNPVLTDEEAWDVAAFVNSQPHPPFKEVEKDWPDVSDKPFDYPFGPYADDFSEKQHKYGPFRRMMGERAME